MARKKRKATPYNLIDPIGGIIKAVKERTGEAVKKEDTVHGWGDFPGKDSAPTTAPTTEAAPTKPKRVTHRAVIHQEGLVDQFVTKAYGQKVKAIRRRTPTYEVADRVQKAKRDVENLRERLLTNPSVEAANSKGKVVSPKGLQTLHRREIQKNAIEGPKGVSFSKLYGYEPRSLNVGNKGRELLARSSGLEGSVARTQAVAKERAHEKTEPSTLETLSIASLFIPGLGEAGAAARLAEFGAQLATKEGARELAGAGAARVVAAREGAREAIKSVPKAVQSVPKAVKELPEALRIGARNAPATTKAAIKAVPRATLEAAKASPSAAARGALRGGETTLKAGAGVSFLAGTQNAGLHTPPGQVADAILKGTSAAVSKHPRETAETTLRALPAAITAPAALAYTAGEIPFKGTGPLEQTASGQLQGLETLGGNLLSGDPQRVQKAVQAEGALSLLTPLPAITRSRAYEVVRKDVRDAAAATRRKTGKGRFAPEGVEQNLFGFTERSQARKRVALSHARTSNPMRVSEARHANRILHGTPRRPALSNAPEGAHVALQTLLEYGIRDPKGVALVRQHGPTTEPHVEGRVNLDAALKYAEKHPEIFDDVPFQRALRAGERASKTNPASMVGAGEVARHRAQGDLFNVRPPEERVPVKARAYTSAKTRVEAWKDVGKMEVRVAELKRKARVKGPKKSDPALKQAHHRDHGAWQAWQEALRELDVEKKHLADGQKMLRQFKAKGRDTSVLDFEKRVADSADRVKAKDAAAREADAAAKIASRELKDARFKASRRSSEIKLLEHRTESLKKALDPYVRPGAKSLTSEKRMAWDKSLEKEYLKEVQARQKGSPLVEPVWTHHSTFRGTKMGMEGSSLPGTAGGKAYVRKGSLAENDLVDRGIEAFIRGTVQMPRRKAAGAAFGREFARREKIPFTLNGKARYVVPDSETWAKITAPKTKENPDGGQFDSKSHVRFPIRQWNASVKDPFTPDKDLVGLLSEAEEGRIPGHEPSLIVKRESAREFKAAMNPEHTAFTEVAGKISRGASRAILTTNPAWALAQIPAEAIPLVLAHPELLNPLKTGSILKDLHEFERDHPEEAALIAGVAGASPQITAGSLKTPLDLEREAAYNPQPAMFSDGAKAMTKKLPGRAFSSAIRLEPLGLFDVKRQNAYRSVLLAAEADKQFRGFTSGVHQWFRTSSKISKKFRGKSREEMFTWLTTTKEGKGELAKLADYVDNVQGNWTAFTRYERAFAPLTIFYPFLRYSLRWTLWTFPKTHPLTATIAYMLGQANSNELEKVLGGKPASPLSYSYPVVKDGEGKASILPGGSRIAPGQSGPQQALASGQAPQLLGTLNPVLGAGLTALGGPGPFGQKPSGPAGYAAIDQLLAMPAPLRILASKLGGSENIASMFGVARPQPKSVIATAFEKLDPQKTTRQTLWPPLPQSGKNARMANSLAKALKEAGANSKTKQSDVAGDDSLTVAARQQQIARMKKRSTSAQGTIDKILKDLKLDKENTAAYERYKEALYGGEESGGYGSSEGYGETKGYETGVGYGGGKSSAYKPKGPSFSLPGIPNLSGAIPDFLSTLVGGEKAQAAVPKGVSITGPLTAGEKTFAKTLAKNTTLTPKTAAAWILQEGGNSTGDYNRLNVGHTDSGSLALTTDPRWKDPVKAAELTAEFLKGKFGGASEGIQAILPAAKGKSSSEQLKIIAGSGWATDPAYAEHLQSTLASVGVQPRKPVPKRIMNRFQAGVTAAKELEKATLPYVWGGGHASPTAQPTGGGLDCSGAVSYVLNKMGALKGTLVSGDMGSVLRPGPGAVTVFYSPTHTFMRIGNKYFGTSRSNPGGGAGYIPTSVEEPEAMSGSYNVGHVPGLGKKVAVALGVKVGSTGASASTSFPGMELAHGGTTATITSTGSTVGKPGFSNKPIKATPSQKLANLNRILAGDLSQYGISSAKGPSVSNLASLGRSLEAGQQELMRL